MVCGVVVVAALVVLVKPVDVVVVRALVEYGAVVVVLINPGVINSVGCVVVVVIGMVVIGRVISTSAFSLDDEVRCAT